MTFFRELTLENIGNFKKICKISNNSANAFNSLSKTYKTLRSREMKENCQLPRPSTGFSVLGA